MSACWSNQLIYRAEASVYIIFLGLIIMSASGCAAGAARGYPILKFLAVPVIIIALFFTSNIWMNEFAKFAGLVSPFFLIVQGVKLLDFSYVWNSTWQSNSVAASLRNPSGQEGQAWLAAILSAATVFLVAAIICAFHLWFAFPEGLAHGLIWYALLLSLALLVVSITEWCEHGNLLSSAVMMAYTVWLVFEALAIIPDWGDRIKHHVPWWAALTLAASVLGSPSQAEVGMNPTGAPGNLLSVELPIISGDAESGGAREVHSASPVMTELMTRDFIVHCARHALCVQYITTSLVPSHTWPNFLARCVALLVVPLLYGWSLVAPKVLANRSFE